MNSNTAEKLERIQSLFDSGKSHAQIAKELGYTNIKSFYRYIYRYNNNLSYNKVYEKKQFEVIRSEDKPKKRQSREINQ